MSSNANANANANAAPKSDRSLMFAKGLCMGLGYTMAALSAPRMGQHGRLVCTAAGLAGVVAAWDRNEWANLACAGFAGGAFAGPQGTVRAVLVNGGKLGVSVGAAAVCAEWALERWAGK